MISEDVCVQRPVETHRRFAEQARPEKIEDAARGVERHHGKRQKRERQLAA
ncbi:MAG: hypothetical protein ACXWJV_07220 [Hyphomicrobium sp.]